MIKKLKNIFLRRSLDKKFVDHLIELSKKTPNNYQFGCLIKEKIREYEEGDIKFTSEIKNFSH
jgi:hypothetical protein